jgi:serine/threonine protein kinase
MPAKSEHFYTIGSEVLSGFEIVARLGRGQFGEVWKVRERDNDREFAAKVINLEENDSGFKEIRALKLVAKLNHIHLVKIQTFQVRQRNGELVPFKELDEFLKTQRKKLRELVIVMELGDQSLSDRLRDYQEQANTMGGLPVPELQRYLLGAARGIDYLYGNNQIVHCDIKPANLLIFGQDVKVADCGVAVSVSGGGTQTVSMSPYYSPPELNRNRPGQWTDQYSLAVTYYELRTGLLPFDRRLGPFDVMRIHDDGKLAFDSPVLKPSEREVLRLATSVNAANRYPTCELFAEQIDRAHKNLPIKRPDECGPPPSVVVKFNPSDVSPKPTRSTGIPPQSGAITFDRNIRRQDEVRKDDIERLVEDSRSPDDIIRTQRADAETESLGLKSTGEPATEVWAGGTMQLGQPMPTEPRPSSKFLTRPSDSETDSGSGSRTKPRTKKSSLVFPAIALSFAMLVAMAGIGFALWKSGQGQSVDSKKGGEVVKNESGELQNTTVSPKADKQQTQLVTTKFDLKELISQIGDDAAALLKERFVQSREWLTGRKSITVAERDRAEVLLKAVQDRIERHRRFIDMIHRMANSDDSVKNMASELAKPIVTDPFVGTIATEHREWAEKLESSFTSLATKARADGFVRLVTQYEAKLTISTEERLRYLTWLEDEAGGKSKSLPQHDRWESRIQSLFNQLVATAKETESKTIAGFFFNGDERRIISNSTMLRYSLLTADSQSKLEAWDRPLREQSVNETVQKLDDAITSIDPKSLADFDGKCRIAYETANLAHDKKHGKNAKQLNLRCSMPQAMTVVALWRDAEKTGDLSQVRRRLIEKAYSNRESLDRSLAQEYMAIALTVKSPESISDQRSVRSIHEETNRQFQKNLATVVKAKLLAADEPIWSDIAKLCERDAALGWSAAAAAEASLARRDRDLQAGNAPTETTVIPADGNDDPDDLNSYRAYLRAWSLLLEGRPPKQTFFKVEPKPAIRVERTLALVTAFNRWRNEMRPFATDFRQRIVADEIFRTIVAVPQPSEKPLEEFGRNPYLGSDVNALIGLSDEAIKHRPLNPSDAAHLALIHAARPENVRQKSLIEKWLESAQLPATPDGSVHAQTGLAFFRLALEFAPSGRDGATARTAARLAALGYAVREKARHASAIKADSEYEEHEKFHRKIVAELIEPSRNDSADKLLPRPFVDYEVTASLLDLELNKEKFEAIHAHIRDRLRPESVGSRITPNTAVLQSADIYCELFRRVLGYDSTVYTVEQYDSYRRQLDDAVKVRPDDFFIHLVRAYHANIEYGGYQLDNPAFKDIRKKREQLTINECRRLANIQLALIAVPKPYRFDTLCYNAAQILFSSANTMGLLGKPGDTPLIFNDCLTILNAALATNPNDKNRVEYLATKVNLLEDMAWMARLRPESHFKEAWSLLLALDERKLSLDRVRVASRYLEWVTSLPMEERRLILRKAIEAAESDPAILTQRYCIRLTARHGTMSDWDRAVASLLRTKVSSLKSENTTFAAETIWNIHRANIGDLLPPRPIAAARIDELNRWIDAVAQLPALTGHAKILVEAVRYERTGDQEKALEVWRSLFRTENWSQPELNSNISGGARLMISRHIYTRFRDSLSQEDRVVLLKAVKDLLPAFSFQTGEFEESELKKWVATIRP